MRLLTEAERELFRKDYQDKDAEVQRSFGVYLSGLALVSGWIVGPGAQEIPKMIAGNYGYNVYLFLGLVALNLIFTCFLIHKSILIHEIMQFVTWLSPQDDALQLWEAWRRSSQSLSRRVRIAYYVLIGLLPMAVSIIIMVAITRMLRSGHPSLSPLDAREPHVWGVYAVVCVLHVIPLWFLFVSWKGAEHQWSKILRGRNISDQFKTLDPNALRASNWQPTSSVESV